MGTGARPSRPGALTLGIGLLLLSPTGAPINRLTPSRSARQNPQKAHRPGLASGRASALPRVIVGGRHRATSVIRFNSSENRSLVGRCIRRMAGKGIQLDLELLSGQEPSA